MTTREWQLRTMTELPQAGVPVPPPELVEQWWGEWRETPDELRNGQMHWQDVVARAAQWGADQELDACCEWLEQNVGRWDISAALRAARRPKPPNLKQQALEALECLQQRTTDPNIIEPIRRALEELPND